MTSAGDLAIHISGLEEDLAKRVSLLSALEDKLTSCQRDNDALGIAFWSDRVADKRRGVQGMQNELLACQDEFSSLNDELEGHVLPGITLRGYAEGEEKEEVSRTQQTADEFAAWRAGNDIETDCAFPPLDEVLHNRPGFGGRRGHNHGRRFGPGPYGPFSHPHRRGPDGFRHFMDRVTDVVNNPAAASALVPTQEIKSMLDTFLVNLSNQLAGTFEGSPGVATRNAPTEPERPVPGAFVATQAAATQTPPQPVEDKVIKPCYGLGKGGFRHKHISCDGCLTGIRGMRYKCQVSCSCDLADNSNVAITIYAARVYPFSPLPTSTLPRTPSRLCSTQVLKRESKSLDRTPTTATLLHAISARRPSLGSE
jgi:next-to-BRCA1 protein 1